MRCQHSTPVPPSSAKKTGTTQSTTGLVVGDGTDTAPNTKDKNTVEIMERKASTNGTAIIQQQSGATKTKKWCHFSEHPFAFNKDHVFPGFQNRSGKRMGLWLSDGELEAQGGTGPTCCSWSEWCVKEDFHTESLAYKTDMTVDMTDIRVVDGTNMEDMKRFHEECFGKDGVAHHDYWFKLDKEYKGFAITPYDRRPFYGTAEYMMVWPWYRFWDVASLVIWDYSCIKEMGQSEAFEAPKKEDLFDGYFEENEEELRVMLDGACPPM